MSTLIEGKEHYLHVISHTHWDREWRYSFQQFRIMLVEMMDHLLETLREHPDYRHFHLDAQTIVLDDYYEVKPEKRAEVEQFIRDGRIIVGPWYVLPDPSPVSGESLLRNLLIGMTATREIGGTGITGYSPFGFGQVSQMPQIYQGFGIDSIMFYRGNNRYETKSEYLWEGPDGSQLLGFRIAELFGRANFWVNVYRPVVLNKWPFNWDYVWDERQLPYHACDGDSYARYDYYLLENRDQVSYHPENLPKALETLKEQSLRDATTRHLLYLDGHDQSEPHPRVAQIVAEANRLFPEDQYLHSSLADYVAAVKSEVKDLQVKHGEFRYTNIDGLWLNLYYGVLASRLYLKQSNHEAENALHGLCEPLCSSAWLLGQEYPTGLLNIAWKQLLQNQAHDSIAGCAIDKVHEDCEYRTRQIREIADTEAMLSLGTLVKHIDAAHLPEDSLLLTIYNALPYVREEICSAVVDVPATWKPGSLRLIDSQGKKAPVQVIAEENFGALVKIPREFPLPYAVRRFHLRFAAGTVLGLGYKTFVVQSEAGIRRNTGSLLTGPHSMANAYLAVEINADGTFALRDKMNGNSYTDLHYFEDTSDIGDPWSRKTVQQEATITSLGAPAKISCIEDGPLSAKFRVVVPLSLPKCALPNGSRRAEEEVEMEMISILTLNRDARRLEIETTFENTVRDHRLRVMFPTDLDCDVSWAESQFDVVSRPIQRPDDASWKEPAPTAHPQLNFCDLSDGRCGLAVLNRGLPEYEAVDDTRRTLAITLLRTHRFPLIGADPDTAPEHPFEKGGQCLRVHTQQYALYPHAGNWEVGDVLPQAYAVNIPLHVALSGRPTGTLPLEASFFTIDSRRITLAALKKAHERDSLALRLSNPTDETITTTIQSLLPLQEAYLLAFDEQRQETLTIAGEKILTVMLPPKKVVTIEVVRGA